MKKALAIAMAMIAIGASVNAQPFNETRRNFQCEAIPYGIPGYAVVPEAQRVPEGAQAPVTIGVLMVYSESVATRGFGGWGDAQRYAEEVFGEVSELFAGRLEGGYYARYAATGVAIRPVGTMPLPSALEPLAQRIENLSASQSASAVRELFSAASADGDIVQEIQSVGADLVQVWTGIDDTGGRGYAGIPSGGEFGLVSVQPSLRFSVIADNNPHSLPIAHELGHNLSLAHDRADATGHPPALPYGRGYSAPHPRYNGLTYGTVMATVDGANLHVFSADAEPPGKVRIGDRDTRAVDAIVAMAPFVAAYSGAGLAPEPCPDPEPCPECPEPPPCPDPEPCPICPEPPPPPDPNRTSIVLNGFTVWADFTVDDSRSDARVVPVDLPGDESALFYFFNPENSEILVKVLNGCRINGYWWVYHAAATTLYIDLTVESRSGQTWTWGGYGGVAADVSAFQCE